MNKIFFFSFLVLSQFSFAQNRAPLVKQWDKRFGGTNQEVLTSLLQTTDGGYILGGTSESGVGGDKTQPLWDTSAIYINRGDYWIVKIDSLGNKQWDKRFGGILGDNLTSLQQTTDGGYILGGHSNSGISGDKAQPNWDTSSRSPSFDYWIIKIDSLGNKQWDKRFGGKSDDELTCLKQTKDGGYILGGYSNSDSSGDKTQPSFIGGYFGYDYWIVKIDSQGNKQWDKDYGGTKKDYLYSIHQTEDGGHILGGASESDSSGDKTQPSWGNYDCWIVKIDSAGNKQWDRDFGGTNADGIESLQQTVDKGYIMGGVSQSGVGGDKTQPLWGGIGDFDYWIIKTDSLGNKSWDRDLGGKDAEDDFGNILQTSDGGYLITGTSESPISGDKTENNLGAEQSWVVKIDSHGNKIWDKTIFTKTINDDEIGYAIQTNDGGYAIANYTNSDIGGYKTQHNWDTTLFTTDYWIVKFGDTATCTFAYAGTISALPDTICAGTAAKLSVIGNTAAVQWQSSATNGGFKTISGATDSLYSQIITQNTYYRVFAGNGICSDTSAPLQIVAIPAPPIDFTWTLRGDTVTFNSIGEGYALFWDFADGDTSNFSNAVHIYDSTGTYHVCLTLANNTTCNFKFCQDVIIYPLEIANVTSEMNWNIYPDPFNNNFYITAAVTNPAIESIEVYDVLGQVVMRKDFEQTNYNNLTIDASTLVNGIYYLKIKTQQQDYMQPVIKE